MHANQFERVVAGLPGGPSHSCSAHLPLQVASFQCLQPFMGTLLAFSVLGEEPTWWDLGAVGVVIGLLLIVKDQRDFARLKRLMSSHSMSKLLQGALFQQGGTAANGALA